MTTQPLLKGAGITGFITLFFVAYFQLLNSPLFPVTVMPVTVVDSWIRFAPETLIVYLSLWIYVLLAPALISSKPRLFAFGWEAGGLAVVGLGIFFFFPTVIPVPDIDWSRHSGFAFLKTIDASGNACPSLHVAFAVFTAIRLGHTLREFGARAAFHAISWLWCAGIVYSTLSTKQHVVVDVLAGALLGTLAGVIQWTRWLRRKSL